jgi:hypothetical protein
MRHSPKVCLVIAELAPLLSIINCIWLIFASGEPIFYFTISAWATCVSYAFEDIFVERENYGPFYHPLVLAGMWGFIATVHMMILSVKG